MVFVAGEVPCAAGPLRNAAPRSTRPGPRPVRNHFCGSHCFPTRPARSAPLLHQRPAPLLYLPALLAPFFGFFPTIPHCLYSPSTSVTIFSNARIPMDHILESEVGQTDFLNRGASALLAVQDPSLWLHAQVPPSPIWLSSSWILIFFWT